MEAFTIFHMYHLASALIGTLLYACKPFLKSVGLKDVIAISARLDRSVIYTRWYFLIQKYSMHF